VKGVLTWGASKIFGAGTHDPRKEALSDG